MNPKPLHSFKDRLKDFFSSIFVFAIYGLMLVATFFNVLFPENPTCQTVTIPFQTNYVDDATKSVGDSYADPTGVPGERYICHKKDGTETANEIRKQAIDEVYHLGTLRSSPPVQEYQGGSICRDGSYSYSVGRGTCSWHGGVDHYL